MIDTSAVPMKVRDLQVGDMVDMEADYGPKDETLRMLAEFELAVVSEVVVESPGCTVVSYDNFGVHGYDPGQVVMVVRPVVPPGVSRFSW